MACFKGNVMSCGSTAAFTNVQPIPPSLQPAGGKIEGSCSGYRPLRLLRPIGLALLLGLPAASWAGDGPSVKGLIIGTYQTAFDSNIAGRPIEGEGSGALDLAGSLPAFGGSLQLEIRGATTPGRDGVVSVLPEANASVGETLDKNDQGRIVVWQAFYQHDVGPGSLAAGLIDPGAWLDGNDVANDEFTQFLGASFVKNLTIDLPSPTLGAAYTAGLGNGWGLTALTSNATGIEPDYEEAFRLGRQGNGVFAALEVQWAGSDLVANLGAWVNTRLHDTDGDGIDDHRLTGGSGRGVYSNLSGSLGPGRWNLRLGCADPAVQPAAGLMALAYAYPIGDKVLGIGVAHTFASYRIPVPHQDMDQAEVYVRLPLGRGFTVSPDLQYIAHSDFNPAQSGSWVAGVRVAWNF
jgi:hypothetical protein